MVYLKNNLVIFLAVLFTAVFFSPAAFVSAGTGLEHGDGSPPHGVTSEGDAYGTKLYGALSVSMPSLDTDGNGTVLYVIRLRNKNELKLFHGETSAVNHLEVDNIQTAILESASAKILDEFGFTELQLKNVDEFMDDIVEVSDGYGGWIAVAAYGMMDVVFAAK